MGTIEIILIVAILIFIGGKVFFLVKWLSAKAEADLIRQKMEDAQNLIEMNKSVLDDEIIAKEKALHELSDTKTLLALSHQENELLKQQMQDWNKTKEEFLHIAQASTSEIGTKLSNKLLDDHKREAKMSREEGEKRVKQTTEELNKQFSTVFESMKSLNDQVQENRSTVDVVRQSLLNPSGAGSLSEITLENIFKNSNLIAKQDYTLQHFVANGQSGGLRPDAVVYLPGNNVMVVDSKASKFFLELGEAQSDQERKALEAQLKKSMNQHLKDLIKKDYRQAVEQCIKEDGRKADANMVTLFMFLPTEAALENLRAIDTKFLDTAWNNNIIPVGPTGLVNALLHAHLLVSNEQQEKNYQAIINEVKGMVNSIATLYNHADGIGKNLKSSLKKYDEFAASFNSRFLSKARKLDKLGLSEEKSRNLPALKRYSINDSDTLINIDYDEDEEENKPPLLKQIDNN